MQQRHSAPSLRTFGGFDPAASIPTKHSATSGSSSEDRQPISAASRVAIGRQRVVTYGSGRQNAHESNPPPPLKRIASSFRSEHSHAPSRGVFHARTTARRNS